MIVTVQIIVENTYLLGMDKPLVISIVLISLGYINAIYMEAACRVSKCHCGAR